MSTARKVEVNKGLPEWLIKRFEGRSMEIMEGLHAKVVNADGEEFALFNGDKLLAEALYAHFKDMGLACQCKDFPSSTAVAVYNFEVA